MPTPATTRRQALAALTTGPLLLGDLLAQAQGRAPVRVGLMAALSVTSWTAPKTVAAGLKVAVSHLNAAGGVLGGRPLELVEFDHRSTTALAQQAVQDFAKTPDLVAMFCDSFSPTALEAVPLAHELQLPMLNPWAAADGIIDHGRSPSYTFRLSLRDSWAMPAIVRAASRRRLGSLGLMAIGNGWGRSNEVAFRSAVAAASPQARVAGVEWHTATDGPAAMRGKYDRLAAAGAQAIVLVAAVDDSCALLAGLESLAPDQRLPILSHWGLTAGDFAKACAARTDAGDLQVVQTFDFASSRHPRAREVQAEAARLVQAATPEQLPSPAGVAHAYDLMHILARAIDAAGSTHRPAIRDALEKLGPHRGLVKNYDRPFTPERHEALSEKDVFLARFDRQGLLRRV